MCIPFFLNFSFVIIGFFQLITNSLIISQRFHLFSFSIVLEVLNRFN
jgi:hypothetical protein